MNNTELIKELAIRRNITFSGDDVYLITPHELSMLDPGTELISILGKKVIVGEDYIHGDTRGGYLAFGFENN